VGKREDRIGYGRGPKIGEKSANGWNTTAFKIEYLPRLPGVSVQGIINQQNGCARRPPGWRGSGK
jgi:hypothetical protein